MSDRLTDGDIEAIILGYQLGSTTRQLAGRYGIGKTAIQDLLQNAGTSMRKQQLTDGEVAVAAELYCAGLPLAAVAEQLGTHSSTIRRTLTRAGAKLRPRSDRSTS